MATMDDAWVMMVTLCGNGFPVHMLIWVGWSQIDYTRERGEGLGIVGLELGWICDEKGTREPIDFPL